MVGEGARQAINLACDKLSAEESIKIIKAWCADENIASVKALEGNGFKRNYKFRDKCIWRKI